MRFRFATVLIVAAACSGDDTPTPTGVLDPPPDGEGLQLSLVHSLAPGEEIHWCRYMVLDRAIDVGRFDHAYSDGSHHIIGYTTQLTADTLPVTGDFDCENGENEVFTGIMYAGGVPTGTLALPEGVGFHLDKGAVVLIEGHYLNPTDAPLDAEVALNLWDAPTAVTQQAGTLFFYDNNIYVPANGAFSAHMSCEISQDINVISLLSHMHSRGIRYVAHATVGDQSTQLLATDQWLNPEPTVLATPMPFAAGTRFDYSCDYQDTTGKAVMEGPSKTDNEMCMLIGMYWPRMDFGHEFCAAPGSGTVFDGTQTCGQTLQCQQGATDGLAAEQCAVNTCRASGPALGNVQSCVFAKCIGAGQCSGPDCASCAIASCGAELQTCQAATCN